MRLRDYSDTLPKPMVPIGNQPILWHIMKYYAHYGHRDFILCLGYKADVIKRYFLEYNECISNDFVLNGVGGTPELLSRDIDNWRISFVDTGLTACVGERLKAVQPHLEGEEMFLASYADGVSDVCLPSLVDYTRTRGKTACFTGVRSTSMFHMIKSDDSGLVKSIEHVRDSNVRINGGFFALTRDIFEYLRPGEDLVGPTFQRLIEKGELLTYPHDGFWACMDTFKEKQELDDLCAAGKAPWMVWQNEKQNERSSRSSLKTTSSV